MTPNWFTTLLVFVLGFIAGSIGLLAFFFSSWKKNQRRSENQTQDGVQTGHIIVDEVKVEGVYDSDGNEIPKDSPIYQAIMEDLKRRNTGK